MTGTLFGEAGEWGAMAGAGGPGNGEEPPEVTLLSSRDTPAGRSALTELEDHWRELKAASPFLPRRADLDASRIAGALPHAFVLERAASGGARFRIAGRSVAGLIGDEPQGVPFSTLFTPASRPSLQAWTDRCFDGPALVDLMVETSLGPLRAPMRGRLLLLPMLDGDDRATRALAGLLMEGVPRRGGQRFALSDAVPRVETLAPASPARRAFAMTAAASAGPGLREAERPYLRLVISNP